ncbi:MAG: sulfite exporter TauE/SafE family protein [Leptolyngbyaceae cyanobacterium MO_188.B28]|nr:sulfite exporter TauE/SafE family protein [Leptolyngbyaceae cyanobacterium MO_188.B28]
MNPADLFAPEYAGLSLIGVIVGLLATLLGIGGGLLMVPTLTLWGATPIQAVATSLAGIVLSSTSGTFQNWRMKQLNIERVALLTPPAMLMSEVGVWISNHLPSTLLLISFATLQVCAIFITRLKRQLKRSGPPIFAVSGGVTGDCESSALKNDNLSTAVTATVTSKVLIFQIQAIGLLAGLLAGLFGVGGGIVMVPLQMLFLGEPIKDAVRTSLGAVSLISVWALAHHALSGNVLWQAGLYLGMGGLLGAQLGARLLPKLPDAWVNTLFRGLLLMMASSMIIKALLGA